MSLQPVNQEQVQKTCQVLLDYLDNPINVTPNNILEGVVSAKSLIRAIVQGGLLVCQSVVDQPVDTPEAIAVPDDTSDA